MSKVIMYCYIVMDVEGAENMTEEEVEDTILERYSKMHPLEVKAGICYEDFEVEEEE